MLFHFDKSTLLVLIGVMLLTHCATIPQGLTYSNFLKVEKGMSEQEVIKILGEPTKVTTVNLETGIGAFLGLDELSGTNMIWTTDKVKANVIFFKGKVKSSNFTNQF